jgi:Toprim-like
MWSPLGRRMPSSRELAMGEQELAAAHQRLARLVWPPRVLRADQARVGSRATLLELGYGWERGLVIIPIRGGHGGLRGILRYAPSHDHAPKVLAARGTRLGLIPHPCTESSRWVVLVEAPPDMISARSRGLPAIAVPGDDAWEPAWARLFAGRQVSVALDCDGAGRHATARIAADPKAAGVRGSIVDLARGRTDGYDLTEWLAERENLGAQELRRALGMPGTRPRARVRAAGR